MLLDWVLLTPEGPRPFPRPAAEPLRLPLTPQRPPLCPSGGGWLVSGPAPQAAALPRATSPALGGTGLQPSGSAVPVAGPAPPHPDRPQDHPHLQPSLRHALHSPGRGQPGSHGGLRPLAPLPRTSSSLVPAASLGLSPSSRLSSLQPGLWPAARCPGLTFPWAALSAGFSVCTPRLSRGGSASPSSFPASLASTRPCSLGLCLRQAWVCSWLIGQARDSQLQHGRGRSWALVARLTPRREPRPAQGTRQGPGWAQRQELVTWT